MLIRESGVITSDGEYSLDSGKRGDTSDISVIYVSGTTGAATLTLNYKDALDVLVPYEDGVFTVNKQYEVRHGVGVKPVLVVASADGSTEIAVSIRSVG